MSMEMPSDIAEYILGPWLIQLIGTCVDLVFQGVLLAQFAKYFTMFPGDPPSLKIYVGVLLVLTCLKSMDAFAIIWRFIIPRTSLSNPKAFYFEVGGSWYTGSTGAFGHTIALYVQSYYCFRLFVLCRRWYLVAAVSVLLLMSYVVMLIGVSLRAAPASALKVTPLRVSQTALSFQGRVLSSQTWCTRSVFTASVGGRVRLDRDDGVLPPQGRRVSPSSAGLLKALTVLAFQTAAPAVFCALLTFILSVVFPNRYDYVRATVAQGPNILLPELYAFSLMWTLNARREWRKGVAGTVVVDSPTGVKGMQ
ncbi:hypothetical protein FB45DRAFT_1131328 [Roridomyces roridus]|uniref:Uncharacterized protein n=1 Tax=Roridomyces roridus TaxID=1738132 RepID=A0AAD7B1A5_9AGAR|nr:hypothetical protein FB45DRAFT_1131328 [Roridomyces roridus]